MALEKLRMQNLNTQAWIECQFNPTEYSISKANNWDGKPQTGKNIPKSDYGGGGGKTLTMQLLFDAFDFKKPGGDVIQPINELWKFVVVETSTKDPWQDGRDRPPLCFVQWGENWHFTAAVTNLKVRYLLFQEDGRPARAIADITLVEAVDDRAHKGTNPTSYAEPGHRRREVQPRETLAWIAYDEYGDSGRWRVIAEANRLEDPLGLQPGQILAIPPLR